MKHENVKPYREEGEREEQVKEMFDNIAPTYDRLNHSMAWSIDRWWRRKALRKIKPENNKDFNGDLIDIATGTGDLILDSAKIIHPQFIHAADISEGMMEIGRQKVVDKRLDTIVKFKKDDAMALSSEDNSFDYVVSAYGLRNFPDLKQSFQEMYRVSKEGGKLCLVELATPPSAPMRQLFWLYSHTVMPAIGWLMSRDIKAYRYLVKTIEAFPQAEIIDDMLRSVGFKNVEHQRMTFGICTYFTASK